MNDFFVTLSANQNDIIYKNNEIEITKKLPKKFDICGNYEVAISDCNFSVDKFETISPLTINNMFNNFIKFDNFVPKCKLNISSSNNLIDDIDSINADIKIRLRAYYTYISWLFINQIEKNNARFINSFKTKNNITEGYIWVAKYAVMDHFYVMNNNLEKELPNIVIANKELRNPFQSAIWTSYLNKFIESNNNKCLVKTLEITEFEKTNFYKTKKISIDALNFEELSDLEIEDFASLYVHNDVWPEFSLKKNLHNQISFSVKNINAKDITFDGSIQFFKNCKNIPYTDIKLNTYYNYKFLSPQLIAICSDLIENQIWNDNLLPILYVYKKDNQSKNYHYFPLKNKRFKNITIKLKLLDNNYTKFFLKDNLIFIVLHFRKN